MPPGASKLRYVKQTAPGTLLTTQEVTALVQDAPAGSYWYIGGEPNNPAVLVLPSEYADAFNHYFVSIKAADPSAKITGPSILNWDFTCVGCLGYESGQSWLTQFISAYESKYGQKPPVDVWAIDVYPIDWTNTPNNDPARKAFYQGEGGFFLHSEIAVAQVTGMRQYLDTLAEYADTPIWITEIAVHVGYDGWVFDSPLDPVGAYHWDKMSNYLHEVLDGFEANAIALNIEKWFFFKSWKNIIDVGNDGYMGIIFFDDEGSSASRNCLGDAYRARSLGLPRLGCDSAGNTVAVQ